jgi:hypothetical protein
MGKIYPEFSSFQQMQVTQKGKADKKEKKILVSAGLSFLSALLFQIYFFRQGALLILYFPL